VAAVVAAFPAAGLAAVAAERSRKLPTSKSKISPRGRGNREKNKADCQDRRNCPKLISFLFFCLSFRVSKGLRFCAIAFPRLLYLHGTFAVYDSLHPATHRPEASHANYYASPFSLSEAEGPAPLHHRVITNCLDDGSLKSSGADPSASHLEHVNGDGMTCSAQGGAFNRTVTRERDAVNQETFSSEYE
jgi:hypothetical protein